MQDIRCQALRGTPGGVERAAGPLKPFLKVGESSLALFSAPGTSVTRDVPWQVLYGRKQIERYVGGLIVSGISVRNIVDKRPERRRAGWFREGGTGYPVGERQTGKESRGNALHVSFHAGKLACDEDVWRGAKAEIRAEQPWGIEVRVAVNLSEAQELGTFESRDHAQDSLLFGKFEVVLESHQVIA
jgi:hypothetical protein